MAADLEWVRSKGATTGPLYCTLLTGSFQFVIPSLNWKEYVCAPGRGSGCPVDDVITADFLSGGHDNGVTVHNTCGRSRRMDCCRGPSRRMTYAGRRPRGTGWGHPRRHRPLRKFAVAAAPRNISASARPAFLGGLPGSLKLKKFIRSEVLPRASRAPRLGRPKFASMNLSSRSELAPAGRDESRLGVRRDDQEARRKSHASAVNLRQRDMVVETPEFIPGNEDGGGGPFRAFHDRIDDGSHEVLGKLDELRGMI